MRNHQWPDRVLLQSCLTSRNSCLSVSAALWLHHWTDFLLFSFSLLHVKEELNQLYPFGTCHPSHVGTFRKPGWNVLPSSHPINLLDSCYSLGFPSTWSKTGKTFPLRLFSAALAEVELRPCPFIPTQSWQRVDSPVLWSHNSHFPRKQGWKWDLWTAGHKPHAANPTGSWHRQQEVGKAAFRSTSSSLMLILPLLLPRSKYLLRGDTLSSRDFPA